MIGPSRRAHLLAALACGAISLQLGWAAATGSPSLRVPAAVAFVAAWVFAVSAARLLQLLVQPRSGGDGFAALIFGGLTAIGAWIAVEPGARVCAAGLSEQRMRLPKALDAASRSVRGRS